MVQLKRSLPSDQTQVSTAEGVQTKRLRLVSTSDDVVDMIESMAKCDDVISNRATLRQLSTRQSQYPTVSEKIIFAIRSNIASFDQGILPEVWMLLNDCFGTLGSVDDEIHAEFLTLANEELENDSPVVRRAVIGFMGDYLPITTQFKRIMDMMSGTVLIS